jgi:hypothetical protein
MFGYTGSLQCGQVPYLNCFQFSYAGVVAKIILIRILNIMCMGRKEVCTGCWWGNLRERGHWGDPDVDGRIILRWMFRKLEVVVGTG